MEIKTAEDILFDHNSETCYNGDGSRSSTHWETEEVIKAMQVYAKQFIDLAIEKATVKHEVFIGGGIQPIVDKQSIIDIKQLIK